MKVAYFDAAEVARLYHVTEGYARKMAHVHRWRRVRICGRVRYLLEDVEAWNRARPRVARACREA